MKIGIHSDFHFESHADGGKTVISELPDADVMVIAGDMNNNYKLLDSFEMMCNKFEQVVYVIGNHDLWDSSFSEVRKVIDRAHAKFSNLHVLDNSVATIGGMRFVGATLFFEYDPLNTTKEQYLVDFALVENYRNEVYRENELAQKFLYGFTQPGDIVITHHMPTYKSVHQVFERDALNCFFVCDMERMIASRHPSVWIHGHTHFSFDYMFMDTRIICNPFGYAFALNHYWDANKIVEM
jgi:predicted phosphodiesterase